MLKKICKSKSKKAILILVLLIVMSTRAIASNQEIKVTINGIQLYTEVSPRSINGRILVPMRAIFEAMRAEVEWHGPTQTVIGKKDNKEITLQIGNTKASVDGEEVELDSPAIVERGSTLVPVRFIAESLGADVSWIKESKTVAIKDKVDNKTEKPELPAKRDLAKEDNLEERIQFIESEVLRLSNIEREKVGLPPLEMDKKLSGIARIKSQDMADKKYFSHTSPTYGSPFDMMKRFGVKYRAAGENVAMGQESPEEVVDSWMKSQGHKENILSSKFGAFGVGYVEQGKNTYWTQMFTN